MSESLKMSETVMLIDASFLNYLVNDLKSNFERMLNRQLDDINLSDLIVYLALDAGLRQNENQVHVYFVYDKESAKLNHCSPSDLKKELNNVAFKDALGEFSFFTFQTEDMTTIEDLYLESLKVISVAEEVKRIIVISFNEKYGDKVTEILNATQRKELIQFRMDEPVGETNFKWEILAYPVMQSLGIKGEELQ